MKMALKWGRVGAAVAAALLLVGSALVWMQPRTTGIQQDQSDSEQGGNMADRQRMLKAKQLLAQVTAASSPVAAEPLAEWLEQTQAPKVAVAASGPDPDAGAMDYAQLNLGVLKDAKGLQLIVGDEAYRPGAKLPWGDVLESMSTDKAVIKRRSGRKAVVKLDS